MPTTQPLIVASISHSDAGLFDPAERYIKTQLVDNGFNGVGGAYDDEKTAISHVKPDIVMVWMTWGITPGNPDLEFQAFESARAIPALAKVVDVWEYAYYIARHRALAAKRLVWSYVGNLTPHTYWTSVANNSVEFKRRVKINQYANLAAKVDVIAIDILGSKLITDLEYKAMEELFKLGLPGGGMEAWPNFDTGGPASNPKIVTLSGLSVMSQTSFNTFAALPQFMKGQIFIWITPVSTAQEALDKAAQWYAMGFNIIISPWNWNDSPPVTAATIRAKALSLGLGVVDG